MEPTSSPTAPDTRNKWIRRSIVLGLLAVPLGLFLLMTNSKQQFRKLPVFYQDSVAANGDSLPIVIPPFQFLNQDSQTITEANLKGRIHVADFFFTECPGICPRLTQGFVQLQKDLKDFPNVVLVSYSIDARRDSVAALRKYAQKYQVDAKRWHLLTGDEQALFNHSKLGYKLPAYRDVNSPEDGIVHSNFYVLVDPDLRIRGFYDCIHPNENLAKQEYKRLLDEIKVLQHEYREQLHQTTTQPS